MSEDTSLKITNWLLPKYWSMWLFLGLLRLVALLPLPWIQSLGGLLGWLLYRLVPSRRRIARINIKQAYPEYSEDQIKQLMKASFINMGISVFDMALAWWARRDYLRSRCSIEGMEHLGSNPEPFGKGVRSERDDHKFLGVDVIRGVGATVEDIHQRDG